MGWSLTIEDMRLTSQLYPWIGFLLQDALEANVIWAIRFIRSRIPCLANVSNVLTTERSIALELQHVRWVVRGIVVTRAGDIPSFDLKTSENLNIFAQKANLDICLPIENFKKSHLLSDNVQTSTETSIKLSMEQV